MGEKRFHCYPLPVTRYPLSVTSVCFVPEVKSLMAGGGEPLLGIRTPIPPLHQSPITNHFFPLRQSMPSVGEKRFHRYLLTVIRYPLSVTSGCFAPQVKSLMAGGGGHLLGIRISIPPLHQSPITNHFFPPRQSMPSVGEKRFHRYLLPVIRDQWPLCTRSQKSDGGRGEQLLIFTTQMNIIS